MAKRSSRRWIVVTRRSIDTLGRRRAGRGGVVSPDISLDEWLLHVAADPALEQVRLAANENEALRDARPARVIGRATDRWLYWMGGEIWVTMPDPAMLVTVRRLARSLGGYVVDEENAWLRPSPRGGGHGERPRVRRIVSPSSRGLPNGDPIDRSDHRRVRSTSPRRDSAFGADDRGGANEGDGTGAPEEEATVRGGTRTGVDPDDPAGLSCRAHETTVVERQARQVLIVAGTVVCVASAMWLMQA